jgi:hypothetical protein
MKRKGGLVGALVTSLLVAAAVTGAVLAANTYEIFPHVIGGGGGHSESGEYVLDSTMGQAVVGNVGRSGYGLSGGFWSGQVSYHSLNIPLVLRGFRSRARPRRRGAASLAAWALHTPGSCTLRSRQDEAVLTGDCQTPDLPADGGCG